MKQIYISKRKILPLLFFIIFNLSFITAHATIRYVSHSGSNAPPYLSWETAADSIMSAINISVFGDTIYVASGVYKEKIVMIPGLTLIGSGMDSCIINTKEFNHPIGFASVTLANSATFKNFKVVVANNANGSAVSSENTTGTIESSKLMDGYYGSFISGSSTTIKNCIILNCEVGIQLLNAPSLVKMNNINNVTRGIIITAVYDTYKPLVESNIITAQIQGILIEFGTKPTIRNNIIYLTADFATGYEGGDNDTTWLYNNLVIAKGEFNNIRGLNNSIRPTFCINNFLIGSFGFKGIDAENLNIVKNNNIMNSPKGITQTPGDNPIIKYNNSWNNGVNYGGFTPDSTNLSVDPMVVNEDSTQGELDFHLQKFSPLINAGDPNILDRDITRSDIGLYGGPFGESYQYLDLAPKPPRNLSAVVDSQYITLSWNRNTEADFNSYNLYRDTTANFTADTTTFVVNLTDTSYQQIIPQGTDAFYYKLRAIDNQGNISVPSEELPVIITSVEEYPVIVSNYQLYQNYPNPFNPSTKIGYKLKERGYVKLMIYDIKGELVGVLVNKVQDAGYHEIEFNAGGSAGGGVGKGFKPVLASGVYIYQIMVKNGNNIPVFTDMKKMLMIK